MKAVCGRAVPTSVMPQGVEHTALQARQGFGFPRKFWRWYHRNYIEDMTDEERANIPEEEVRCRHSERESKGEPDANETREDF